jgi:hypothetical protein
VNFIEKVFNISPDGGNGMTELAIFIACVFAMGLFVWRRRAKKAHKR